MKWIIPLLLLPLILAGCFWDNPAEPEPAVDPSSYYIEITYPSHLLFCLGSQEPSEIRWDSDIPRDQGKVIAAYGRFGWDEHPWEFVGYWANTGGHSWPSTYWGFGAWALRTTTIQGIPE